MKLKLFGGKKTRKRPARHSGIKPFVLYDDTKQEDDGQISSFRLYNGRKAPQPARHKLTFTLIGDAGKPWRIALLALTGVIVIVLLVVFNRREPQLMSAPEIGVIQDAGVLRVGVRENMLGMSNNGAGLEIELGQRLAERILPDITGGDAVQYVTVNSRTAGPRISDGTINVAAAMMRKGAISSLSYSDAYYSDICRFVIRNGESVTASGITVGCVQGGAEASMLASYIEAKPISNVTSKQFASYSEMLDALEKKRVDAVVMTDIYIDMFDSDYDITATGLELGTVDYAFACASDSSAIIEIANLMLEEMRQNGELSALMSKYGLG